MSTTRVTYRTVCAATVEEEWVFEVPTVWLAALYAEDNPSPERSFEALLSAFGPKAVRNVSVSDEEERQVTGVEMGPAD